MAYRSNMAAFNAKFQQKQRATLEAVGVFVTGEAQLRTPVDTGNLRGSYTHERDGYKRVVIGSPVKYAVYVEKGTGKYVAGGRKTPWRFKGRDGRFYWTSGQRPQPHLGPAAEKNVERIRQIVARYMKI